VRIHLTRIAVGLSLSADITAKGDYSHAILSSIAAIVLTSER
jgi:hypothetical protein